MPANTMDPPGRPNKKEFKMAEGQAVLVSYDLPDKWSQAE